MGRVRVRAVANEDIRVSQIALGQRAWPEKVQRIGNSFHNQLELPILFYAVLLFAMQIGGTGALFVGLAWTFVGARLVHAIVHVNGGQIRLRFMCYAAGVFVLVAMWALLTFRVV